MYQLATAPNKYAQNPCFNALTLPVTIKEMPAVMPPRRTPVYKER